eukprot:6483967-Amphidinium_carterae.2
MAFASRVVGAPSIGHSSRSWRGHNRFEKQGRQASQALSLLFLARLVCSAPYSTSRTWFPIDVCTVSVDMLLLMLGAGISPAVGALRLNKTARLMRVIPMVLLPLNAKVTSLMVLCISFALDATCCQSFVGALKEVACAQNFGESWHVVRTAAELEVKWLVK